MTINDFIKAGLEAGHDGDALKAYSEGTLDTELDIENFEEAYAGIFKSDEDFAQDMADSTGAINITFSDWPLYCIDWERAARDLMMDYWSNEDHYFRFL